jgi:hypothetical protein
MNDLINHCDPSFGVLKNKLKKLDPFFSHTPIVQPLVAIQKELAEMKADLTSIKDQFQTQISSGSVDLYIAWKSSLSFVNIYSHKSIHIRRLVSNHIQEVIDFYIGMLNFRSEFSFLKIRLIEIKGMVNYNNLNIITQSLCMLVPLMDIYFSECG